MICCWASTRISDNLYIKPTSKHRKTCSVIYGHKIYETLKKFTSVKERRKPSLIKSRFGGQEKMKKSRFPPKIFSKQKKVCIFCDRLQHLSGSLSRGSLSPLQNLPSTTHMMKEYQKKYFSLQHLCSYQTNDRHSIWVLITFVLNKPVITFWLSQAWVIEIFSIFQEENLKSLMSNIFLKEKKTCYVSGIQQCFICLIFQVPTNFHG